MNPNNHDINNLERYMYETLSKIDESHSRLGRISAPLLVQYLPNIENNIAALQRVVDFVKKNTEKENDATE